MDDSNIHPGIVLQRKRIERGLSVVDINRMTGIRVPIIEAIEAGSFDIMPAVYMRSFIQQYARAVGVATAELPPFQMHRSHHGSREKSPLMQERSSSKNRSYLLIAGIGLLAVITYILYLGDPNISSHEKVIGEVPVETLRLTPSLIDSSIIAQTLGLAQQGGFRLEAYAHDTVWISITIDGKRSEQLTLQPGQRKQWHAIETIIISVGNVGGVDFYRDGTKLPPFGERGEVVRYIRITAKDVIPSTSSWAYRRDSVLKKLELQQKSNGDSTLHDTQLLPLNSPKKISTPAQKKSQEIPQRPNLQRRENILLRARQQQQITTVPPKAPLPTTSTPSSP